MLGPIIIGMTAALLVFLSQWVRVFFSLIPWNAPILIFGVAMIAMLLQRFYWDRLGPLKKYDGLADLLVHIHSPGENDTPTRWSTRGVISFLLSVVSGPVGPEGAAIEVSHAVAIRNRPVSSRWSEQRRRTDAATAIAAGIAAAFGSPFAGILVAMELGAGGRMVSVALGALTAFMAIKGASILLPAGSVGLHTFDLSGALLFFPAEDWKAWLATFSIIVAAGVLSLGTLALIRYCKDSLSELFHVQPWLRTIGGGVLLFLLALSFASGHAPSSESLEGLLWSRKPLGEAGLLICSQLLALAFTLAAFGTSGVFWPLLALGGFAGFGIDQWIFGGIPGLAVIAAFVGGSGVLGGVLGVPLAASVLAYEMTGNVNLLFPCLLSAFLANALRNRLGLKPLAVRDLQSRGIRLHEGRSTEVLEAIKVSDAMITDHETAHEKEAVADLHQQLARSRYPFLPVVSEQGVYLGLLTADLVQEGWEAEDPLASHQPLKRLLEAKDLLYRSQLKRAKPVKPDDRLSEATLHLSDHSCLPVVGENGAVVGLLFAYNVRLAYEREVSRRALALQHQRR